MPWIIAKKVEMTRIVKDDKFVPITILEIPTLKIVWIRTLSRDWYNAVVIWILWDKKEWTIKEGNTFLSLNDFTVIREFPVEEKDIEKYNIWDDITFDIFEWIKEVSLTGISKWKWFTWAMKKHNFHGWPWGHGSKFHRALGSIGNRKPRRTHKWKKMHGHHGDIQVTIKKVPLELVNKDASIIGVKGWVPWARNSLVSISF